MIYISEKSENDGIILASFLKEVNIEAEIIGNDIIEDKKFIDGDIVIFTSSKSLVSAMLTKENSRIAKVILVAFSISEFENDLISRNGIIFIKKDKNGKYLEKLLIFLKGKEKR